MSIGSAAWTLGEVIPPGVWEIIRWWELRRILYNLAVGVVGLTSVAVMETLGGRIVGPGEDFVEPLALVAGCLIYAVLANFCYTLGWAVDLLLCKGDPAKGRAFRGLAFRVGMLFACALTSLPIWIVLALWALHRI